MEEPVKSLQHFSHEHPLQYVQSSPNENSLCSGCKITITPFKLFYRCKICEFSLHKVCSTMPKRVMHPSDPTHRLMLLATSSLNRSNKCEACGGVISGFYYSCIKCNINCHMLCVAMPLSVKIPSSHPHILKLELKPPYDFQCDLCDRPSYTGWLYRCRLCEFDAHISCAVTFNGPRSSHDRRSVPQDYSSSHQDELMELLSEGMKGIEVNNEKVLVQDQLQFQPLEQSILKSDDFTLPSYQFSDACFSIDIAKSIRVEESVNEANSKHNVQELEVVKRDLRRELSFAPSTGIRSHVWTELGQETKDQTAKIENVRIAFLIDVP
ncbi:hypothetical protein BUALT_Bualt12G0005100 [Buddleja alternifolia]|uniref:DC1 domain-containing protein n=1 Tax=Buddleja alternifolia TaxID=168488 RepID=A0AAV6WUC2_9LAMI|nr:hypothetical protein BUALT_Bualt12G0005100 [Buddleja alternifolia]